MTPEGKVKKHIKDILTELNIWFFMPIGGPYSRHGIPDFIGCCNGRFVAIEAKAGRGRTTALQDWTLQKIQIAGGFVMIVNEDNLDLLKQKLEDWKDVCGRSNDNKDGD